MQTAQVTGLDRADLKSLSVDFSSCLKVCVPNSALKAIPASVEFMIARRDQENVLCRGIFCSSN